ncbi:hypothetical protein BO94DRAFT_555986 [Aspergillus sclerotioniger CBS 115572]|uniref:DUF985 domain-containing protein n=1 Tax=Aspergillus sclerotioniger CBS 115572 TaxID=1450535 RepID=A0A317WWV7_9EURO|nr:hypothetical protein BO94DRAFT_555986 [Aspergillus sclerotioniger CBS 115572]PWY89677.1 hypothetical protein BO94DRAFT_555986 [Aspergillus sclerotioniger CBS 115572]
MPIRTTPATPQTLTPHYPTPTRTLANPYHEPAPILTLINKLNLTPHIEGGYFAETDRDEREIIPQQTSTEYQTTTPPTPKTKTKDKNKNEDDIRSLSTTVFYLLTPQSPIGAFHRNRSRTVHTLHRGRGVYVLLRKNHSPHKEGKGMDGDISIETFTVGHDVTRGEKLQWIVEGGDWKGAFLIPDSDGESEGLLVSETVIPGFEFADHEFLQREELRNMLDGREFEEVEWLLRDNYTQGGDFP